MKYCLLFLSCFCFLNANAQINNFERLDSIARSTNAEQESSLNSLAVYFNSISSSKEDLARLVFTWVASHIKYDDDAFNTGKISNQDAPSIFLSRKAVCSGYSEVIKSLCDLLKLNCVIIDGFGKGYGFKNGMPVNGINHSWNAIEFNNKWHLIDATWGSGYAENINGKAVSKFRFCDYWFDVNPKEFIFNHFPDSSKYQFLPKVYTREQFRKLIYVEANAVFAMGFSLDSLLLNIKANPNFQLPEVYNPGKIDFKFETLPMSKKLNSKSTYNFKFISKSTDETKFVLLNNNNLIEFEKSEDLKFIKNVNNLVPGMLHFGKLSDSQIEIIISYEVL